MSSSKLTAFVLFISLFTSQSAAQTTQTTNSGSTTRKFSYSIQSNYGVNVSSTSTPGFQSEGEARMGILPGSFVRNQSGDGGVTMSPTGITITGIDAGLNLNLDPDTTLFRAKLTSVLESTEDTGIESVMLTAGTASVSATGSATTTFTVDSTEALNSSTFTQNF